MRRLRLNRHLTERLGFISLTLMAVVTVVPIVAVVIYILSQGLPAISWEFLADFPRDGMRVGGILPAIVGTFYLTIGTAVFSVPLGIAAAIYLSEYAPDNALTRLIRIAIINLAGIPSVVYGLFGLGLFVLFLKFGTSILAASLTLSIMTLPVIISTAEEALRERKLPLTEENVFLVASAIVPGKNMELNEGIRLLAGKAKINLPLKTKEQPTAATAPTPVPVTPTPTAVAPAQAALAQATPAPVFTAPVTTQCTVVEGAVTRTFRITIEPPTGTSPASAAPVATPAPAPAPAVSPPPAAVEQYTPVFSPFEGKVELVDINVKVGDTVRKGQVVAAVEAMKAKHDVRAPRDGTVVEINAELGSEVFAGKPILTLGG